MSEENPQLEVEVTEDQVQDDQPVTYVPDKTPIEEGPLKGLPAWVRNLTMMFHGYGQNIAHLTNVVQEMEAIFGEITQQIILCCPEEVGKGAENEGPVECVIRIIKEYALMKDQFEPMAARLAAAEKELEELKKGQ